MLDASDKVSPVLRLVYGDVAQACAELGIDYVVVGAAARDLVLQHIYGAPSRRATADVDFGLKVADWHSFDELRIALLRKGYRESSSRHGLTSPGGIPVDIVPFGQVADSDANIAWPPDGETRMSVLGFTEAHDHSDLIRIQNDPEIQIRVATPVGMALLKLIAWNDRSPDVRKKDALDFQHLLSSYSRIPEVNDTAYAERALAERHGWDIDLISAEVLGLRARQMAHQKTAEVIFALADRAEKLEALLWEMASGVEAMLDRSSELLTAFFRGFRGSGYSGGPV